MESKTNYFIVGLTVLVLAAGLLIAGLWLSVGFSNKEYATYIVYMREAVSGLNTDSPVKYNGVTVGYINHITLNRANPQQVQLELKVEKGTPITTSTQATLIAQGITGATFLGLSAQTSSVKPLQKKPNEPYPVIPYKPSFFNQLEHSFNDISVEINRVFNKNNAKHITKTLENLEKISDVIAHNNDYINQSLHDLPLLISDLKKGVGEFRSMSREIATAGAQVSDTMRAGRNSIDKISQQAIPPAVVLLHQLNAIADNLEQVSSEMRQNPAVIIRGIAPLNPGPGE